MRRDVHASALRSAAKVAFSVAFLGGCSAAPAVTAGEEPAGNPDDVDPVTTESELGAKKGKPTKPKLAAPTGTSCHGNDAAPPRASCEAVVAAAFPTEGSYPGVKQAVSSDVQACCVALLDESHGALANHRWDCCANLPDPAPQSVGIACTPWGPPVPPAMRLTKARARRVRAVA